MYQFPKNKNYQNHEHLKMFIDDLYSGKLHREYHLGPQELSSDQDAPEEEQPVKQTEPPKSTFKHLGPSKNRYTLLRDEL